MPKRIKCPHCGYSMPIFYGENTMCVGISVKCKGRRCGKSFEVKVKNGVQIK